jgi:hypothetical protein
MQTARTRPPQPPRSQLRPPLLNPQGCGTGRDCYVCSALVGEKGFVTGGRAPVPGCAGHSGSCAGHGAACPLGAAHIRTSGRPLNRPLNRPPNRPQPGIDMTDAQLDVARRHEAAWAAELGYKAPNTRFVKGRIEYLDEAALPNDSVDVVISKWVWFRGVWR